MDLSTELAQRCLHVKRAATTDFTPERDEFEDLSSRERIAREQATRYQDIARSRAREEAEKTPAETFTGRLYPIPHTLGEATWRIPAVAAGGVMGYHAVARNELPEVEEIRKLVRPTLKETTVAGPREFSQFGQRMYDRLSALNHSDAKNVARRVEQGLLAAPDTLPDLLTPAGSKAARRHILSLALDPTSRSRSRALTRNVMEEAETAYLGMPKGKKGGTPDPRGYFRNLLAPGKETQIKGPPEELSSQFKALLEDQIKAHGRVPGDAASAAGKVETLFRQKPELARQVLGMRPDMLLSEEALAAKKMIESTVGKLGDRSGTSVVQQALHDAAAAGKSGLGEGMSKWRRYGGATAGGLAAALLTGIPLGAYALWKRREGGEAAARAKGRMQEELDKAEGASKQREEVLARMGT